MKIPGFIDSHLHFLGLGYTLCNVDLTDCFSIEAIKAKLNKQKPSNILIGRGWNQENLQENRMLTKQDLNAVSKDIPIVMTRVCGHVLTVNDKMLEIAGITKSTKQVDGGHFDFESGIFSENALSLIQDKLPQPTKDDLKKYMAVANRILLENGITEVASDDFCVFKIPFEDVLEAFIEMYEENKIQVKITEQVNLSLESLKRFISKGYVNKRFGKLRLGPLKILADGSLGGSTAYLKKPYHGSQTNKGIAAYSDTALYELIHLANKNDMDAVIHAIGDASVEQVLHALIKSIEQTKRYHHHHAIIHAQLANQAQIDQMKIYHIGAIVQPIFLNSDIKIVVSRIGDRAKESYLFKSMYRKGINVGFSTDCPIEPVNPLLNIYTAVTRKSLKDSTLSPFILEEAFTVREALTCYTTNNCHYVYKAALDPLDYVVLDKDIFNIKPEAIKDVQVLETYIDGVCVYRKVVH